MRFPSALWIGGFWVFYLDTDLRVFVTELEERNEQLTASLRTERTGMFPVCLCVCA